MKEIQQEFGKFVFPLGTLVCSTHQTPCECISKKFKYGLKMKMKKIKSRRCCAILKNAN